MNEEQIKQKQEESRSRRELARANAKVVEDALLKPYLESLPDLGPRANELQFYHDVHGGKTYAVLPPDADELRTVAMKLLGGGSELAINVHLGIGTVNKDAGDTYNRRIGRVVAQSNMSSVAMKLESVHINETHQRFYLTLGKLQISLQLEKKSFPKFLFAYNR